MRFTIMTSNDLPPGTVLDVQKLLNAETEVFHRFCEVVSEAVVESWKTDEDDAATGHNRNILWPTEFTKCKTDWERIRVLMQLPAMRKFRLDKAHVLVKSPESRGKFMLWSNSARESGNSAWRRGDLNVALCWYNLALLNAMDEEQKALAYANRSLIMVRLKMHESALEDIQRALENNYPTDRRPRLLVRRAQCLLALGRVREAREEFVALQNQQLKAVSSTENASAHNEPLLKLIQTGLSDCTKALGRGERGEPNPDPCLLITYPNPPAPASVQFRGKKGNSGQRLNSSAPFEITYGGDQVGWQLIATRDIEPAELITVDKPYARRLHSSCNSTHCYQCFRRVLNPIMCDRCPFVAFCSESCKAASWTPDWTESSSESNPPTVEGRPCHRFDCGQLPRLLLNDYAGWKRLRQYPTKGETSQAYRTRLLHWPTDGCIGGPKVSFLAFACVARTPPWVILSLAQRKVPTTSANVNGDSAVNDSPLLAFSGRRQFPTGGLHADNYCAIGWLVTNSEKRTPHDLWQRTVAALYLTHCLSAGGYPLDWDENCLLDPTCSDPLPSTAVLPASWAAACMLHHLQCVSSNAHSFTVNRYQEPAAPPEHPLNAPPGVDLCHIEAIELGSCLYPTLSLLNHSCDPNIALVFMRDGACGAFALHPIRKGHVLYGNYGVHYATDCREERHELLISQYHFECTCRACKEGWSSLDNAMPRMICQHCHRLLLIDEDSLKLLVNSLPAGGISTLNHDNRCTCPVAVQYPTLRRFWDFVQGDLERKTTSIPAAYASLRFHQIQPKLLNKHITYLVRMLNTIHLGGLFARPHARFDWSQELLKILLSLRYGCSYKLCEVADDAREVLPLCTVS